MLGIVRIQLVCKVFRTLMTGNFGLAEILRVLAVYSLLSSANNISSPWNFLCAWRSLWPFTIGKSAFAASARRSGRIPLPVIFNCSSGITLAKHLHKTHIGDFFMLKQHVHCYFSMHTCHWTIWLHCMLSHRLTALSWSHEDMHASRVAWTSNATVAVTVAKRTQTLYYLWN